MCNENSFVDTTLQGNEQIEEAIRLYYEDDSDWRFMGILMAVRNRMQEDGHMIFPADVIIDDDGNQQYGLKTIDAEEGLPMLAAFTSQAEFEKAPASGAVSNFIDSMLETVLQEESLGGIMLNPCGQSLFLGKEDIALIMTPGAERFIGM